MNIKEEKFMKIELKASQDDSLIFEMKPTTKFRRVLESYAQNKGIQPDTIKMFFDGERLDLEASPSTIGIEDGDVVDVHYSQIGG
jgi:hypothetical protein